MKKFCVGLALAAACASSMAASFYVVVPVNKSVPQENIKLFLGGYSLPLGVQNQAYAGFDFKNLIDATGDSDFSPLAVNWSVVGGALPVGMTLSSDGVLSGKPGASGVSSFDLQASYKSKHVQQSFDLDVQDKNIYIMTASFDIGSTGVEYSGLASYGIYFAEVDAELDPQLINWEVASGALPSGLSINKSGRITGTPTATGVFKFTLKVSYMDASTQRALQIIIE